jgi:hypothetical protein
MIAVTLPSGRVVELHEPTFGQELAVVAAGHDNLAELMYAKCAVIAPGISREEIESLSRADGRALVMAVGRVWDGRPEDQEAPLENGSALPSTDTEAASSTTTSPLAS